MVSSAEEARAHTLTRRGYAVPTDREEVFLVVVKLELADCEALPSGPRKVGVFPQVHPPSFLLRQQIEEGRG